MVDKVVDKVVDKFRNKFTCTDIKVYKLITENSFINQPALAKKLSLGKTSIQNSIIKLKENKIITRKGSNKKGYWVINKYIDK